MSKPKTNTIKALTGFNNKSAKDNLAYANGVHSGIYTDPEDYPTPPVDEATFKTALDLLSKKITVAADGSKKAIADRNDQEQVVIKMMRELAHYAQTACKEDMTTFLKSGFRAAPAAKSTKPQLSQYIRNITQGKNSGNVQITLVAIEGADAYQVRYASTVNGTLGPWTTQLITKTRPATTITGLTPGAT